MIFPAGFTGFRDASEAPIPSIDIADFKCVCFAVARILGGNVLAFDLANVTPNFHCATIEWGHEPKQASILCNRHYAIAGFCKPRSDCAIEYIDSVDLASALTQVCDWQVLTKEDLETVVDKAALKSMSPADRQAIETARRKGWFSPARTVGDVLFHFWD